MDALAYWKPICYLNQTNIKPICVEFVNRLICSNVVFTLFCIDLWWEGECPLHLGLPIRSVIAGGSYGPTTASWLDVYIFPCFEMFHGFICGNTPRTEHSPFTGIEVILTSSDDPIILLLLAIADLLHFCSVLYDRYTLVLKSNKVATNLTQSSQ